MNEDRGFERELRDVMTELATEGAPESLVERIAAVPRQRQDHARLAGFGRALLGVAAAAAAVVVIVVVANLRTPLVPGPDQGGSPPVAAATEAPSPAAASPTEPAATPEATASAPAVIGPAGGPVPTGFQPLSATFASPDEGWVLGTAGCTGTHCPAVVARTTDGGSTWNAIPAPATTATADRGDTLVAGVSAIRFANARDGWTFGGRELWATHDAGATWTRIGLTTLPGLQADATIAALETDNGLVHAVAITCDPDGCFFAIESSDVQSDAWHAAPLRLPVGAGPVPTAQLVLHESAGWIVQVDRTVVNGARLVDGQWLEWTPPCADVQGPAILASGSATHLVAACNVGEWASPQGEHLFTSADGGQTFGESASPIAIDGVSGVAATGNSTIAVSGATTIAAVGDANGQAVISVSSDGGATWVTAFQSTPGCSIADLGFTTDSQGIAVVRDPGGSGSLFLMTHDGGRTWRSATF